MFYDLTFISLPQTQQQPRTVQAWCVSQHLGLDSPLYELEGSSLHIRSDGYTLAFFWFSAPPPVTLRTKLNTTLLSLNEVGQHSVDIDLKSCRYDAKKEDMRIGMKENKAKEEELWDDLVFPIQKMEENLKHCIFVFGKFATEFRWTVTCSVNLSKTRRKETTEIRVSPLIRRTRSALKFIFQLKVVSLDPQILH